MSNNFNKKKCQQSQENKQIYLQPTNNYKKMNATHICALEEWIKLTDLDSFCGVSIVFLLIFGADSEKIAEYPAIQ